MPESIRLGTEVRDTTVFIYGNWFVGELRFSLETLGEFLSESIYDSDVSESKTCTSCKLEIESSNMNLLLLDDEDMPICSHCRDKLDEKVNEIINQNSLLIVNESI